MKKRVIVLLLAVSLIMTACGSTGSGSQDTQQADVPEPQPGDDVEEDESDTQQADVLGPQPEDNVGEDESDTDPVTYAVKLYMAVSDAEQASNIFDDDIHTKWCSTVGESGTFVIWEASSPIAVNGYAITTANDNSEQPGRNPLSWTLYGCNSDSVPDTNNDWIVIDQRIGDQTLPDADFETHYFEIQTNAPEYQYFMLEITETAGADVVQISEFKMSYQSGPGLIVIKDGSGQAYDKLEADLKMVFDTVYERMAAEYNPNAPKTVVVQIKKSETGVAYTLGNVVTVGLDYHTEHPENYDSFTHELGHVVQQYTMSVPSWLTEGIADYIRDQYGINNVNSGWILPSEVGDDQKYTDSYQVTAAFLKWIEENVNEGTVKEISSLITKGEYKESDWEKITGASLDELWAIYADS